MENTKHPGNDYLVVNNFADAADKRTTEPLSLSPSVKIIPTDRAEALLFALSAYDSQRFLADDTLTDQELIDWHERNQSNITNLIDDLKRGEERLQSWLASIFPDSWLNSPQPIQQDAEIIEERQTDELYYKQMMDRTTEPLKLNNEESQIPERVPDRATQLLEMLAFPHTQEEESPNSG